MKKEDKIICVKIESPTGFEDKNDYVFLYNGDYVKLRRAAQRRLRGVRKKEFNTDWARAVKKDICLDLYKEIARAETSTNREVVFHQIMDIKLNLIQRGAKRSPISSRRVKSYREAKTDEVRYKDK